MNHHVRRPPPAPPSREPRLDPALRLLPPSPPGTRTAPDAVDRNGAAACPPEPVPTAGRLRRPRRRLAVALGLSALATGALVALAFAVGPDVLLRWWHRAPALTLAPVDTTATPLTPDPEARALAEARPDDLLEVASTVGTEDVRALALDVAHRRLLAATHGGLLVIDLAQARQAGGCVELPRSAFTRMGTGDGLPSTTVDDVRVEGDTAWLATGAGLVRLALSGAGIAVDGVFTEGLVSRRTSRLLRRGPDLFVGTWDGGLHRLRDGRLAPVSLGDRRLTQVAALAEGPAGALLVGTPQGLVRLSGGRPARVGRAWITALDVAGHRVLAAGPDGVFEVQGRRLLRRGAVGEVAAAALLRLRGRLLVAGLDGHLIGLGGAEAGAPFDGVPRAALAADGLAFFATAAGLAVGDPAGHLHPVHLGGPPTNDLTSVAVVGGRVVVGTYDRGLFVLEGAAARSLGAPALTPEVDGLVPAGDDALWVATTGGLYRVTLDGDTVRLGAEDGLASDHVTAVSPATDGSLWVATAAGLTHLVPDPTRPRGWAARTWRAAHGLPSDHLYSVAALPGGGAVAGTLHGLVRVRPGGGLEVTRPGDGRLPDGWIQALLPTDEGLWIGTYDAGLVRSRGGRLERLAEGIGRPWGRVNPGALAVHQGRLFVGTQGGGLLAVEDGRVRRYTTAQGLPSDDVTGLAADGASLWVATRGGLARLRFAPSGGALAMEVR